ncbi:MAG: YqgE/AlgH family protein [Alphaproteobacteria bacterium]|nr:YqgE/AlgH family protein [Alphaproteobacteria bacterium]
MPVHDPSSGYLTGNLLIAMPQMRDPRFQRTVIYMCVHNPKGAMGLVVNRLVDSITFPDLLQQLNIDTDNLKQTIRVHFGGPVESGRGFVLHSDDFKDSGTTVVPGGLALTATIDILKAIAGGGGPRRCLLALGYAGWGAGQLDGELQANAWLSAPADEDIVFDGELESKWERALAKIGIAPRMLTGLSGEAGHA